PPPVAPELDELPDLVDVPTLGLLFVHLVEQPLPALLFRGRDGKEVTAAPPPWVDRVGDLVVRVEPEVPRRLAVGRVQNRVVDGGLRQRSAPSDESVSAVAVVRSITAGPQLSAVSAMCDQIRPVSTKFGRQRPDS